MISLGTLTAVFIATNDEALMILASDPAFWGKALQLVLIKLGYGIAVGLSLDIFFSRFIPAEFQIGSGEFSGAMRYLQSPNFVGSGCGQCAPGPSRP